LNGNYQIRIRSDKYPAFLFVLFHIDPLSSEIVEGKSVKGGELIGYARMYYPDLDTYAANSDIGVQVTTPQGLRYISFFETMTDDLFQIYVNRGAGKRSDFIITKEERDANIARFFVVKNRFGRDGIIFPCKFDASKVDIDVLPENAELIEAIEVEIKNKKAKIAKTQLEEIKEKYHQTIEKKEYK